MADLLRRALGRAARELGLRRAPSPPPGPAPLADPSHAAGPCVAGIELHACTLFHSYLRLRGVVTLAPGARERDLAVTVTQDGRAPPQSWNVVDSHGGGSLEFAAEALVDRTFPLGATILSFRAGDRATAWHVQDLLLVAQTRDLRTLMPEFQQHVRDRAAAMAQSGQGRPRLLDIGGRARSGTRMADHFPEADATILDILPGDGVDVVGDAHAMSGLLPPEHFDFALSVSVFEHLLMPWKVAVEMSRVLKTGALAMIHTHQAEAMHDTPWDFWRFSDTAWPALFNAGTGFEIVRIDMSRRMHIVPAVIIEPIGDNENAFGFQCSTVIVRRTGPATLDWDIPLQSVLETAYPKGELPKR